MVHVSPIQLGVTAVIVACAMLLRMRRMGRQRPLRVEQLWIAPAVFLAIVAFVMWQAPPTLADAPWLIGAALIGAVIGWYRGKTMRIIVDPDTHDVSQSASPWAAIFLLALLVLRFGARYWLGEESQTWHIGLAVITDAPLLLAAGMFIMARIEMYLRAQKLLHEARAAKAARGPEQPG